MNNLPTLDQRIKKVEQDLEKFNTRLSTLIWLAGILAAMGLTGGAVSGWFLNTVKDSAHEIEKRRQAIVALQSDEEKARSSLVDINAKVSDAQKVVGELDRIVADKKKELHQYANFLGSAGKNNLAKGSASRALDQVRALETFVPKEPYYQAGYDEDIGQLLNCVDLYISGLRAKTIQSDFQADKPFYDGLERVYEMILSRTQEKIGPSNEPDQGNLKWHTFTWFQKFHESLEQMKNRHAGNGTLTDADLDDFAEQFRHHREAVWGSNFTTWPSPLR